MADPIASASTSNGLGYSSAREVDTTERVNHAPTPKVLGGKKGEDEIEIRIEFGYVQFLTPYISILISK